MLFWYLLKWCIALVFCGVLGDFKLSSGFEEERLNYACILSLVADNQEITGVVAKLGN